MLLATVASASLFALCSSDADGLSPKNASLEFGMMILLLGALAAGFRLGLVPIISLVCLRGLAEQQLAPFGQMLDGGVGAVFVVFVLVVAVFTRRYLNVRGRTAELQGGVVSA
ncbi:MAG: hypothetical protein QM783_05225 [Phycisphaerales bacterium]